jgi:hypothetical protein
VKTLSAFPKHTLWILRLTNQKEIEKKIESMNMEIETLRDELRQLNINFIQGS